MSDRPQIGTPPPLSRSAQLAALRADLALLAALVAEAQTHLARLEARQEDRP